MSNFSSIAVWRMLGNGRAETVTLRRLGNSPPDDLTVLAKIDDATAQPLAGNMAQTMRNVTISNYEIENSSWPGPPKRNDQIITQAGRTLTITAIDPVIVGDALIMHRIKILGG
jgi:hypothetical protein